MTVTTTPTIFPIGATSAAYSPLTLTANTGSSVANVTCADSLLDGLNPQSILITSGNDGAVIKTWKVHNASNIQHMTINTTWHAHIPNSGDEDANFNESQAYIAYRLNQLAGTRWQPLGPTTGSTASSDAADYWDLTDQAASHLNMTSGTDYYIATGCSVSTALPVSLVSFNALYQKKQVDLNWATASETNNSFFDIERSSDGIEWATISKTDGHGTSEVYNVYNAIDNLEGVIPSGTFYYRLKQVDYNGAFQYSSIQSVNISTMASSLQAYPNPVVNTLNVNWTATKNEITILRLINVSGMSILEENISGVGAMQKQIDLSGYPTGTYFLQIITDQNTISKLVFKN